MSKIACLVLAAALSCFAQGPRPTTATPDFGKLLSWLPADTETVVGLNGPFHLRQPDDQGDQAELAPDVQTRSLGLGLTGFNNGGLVSALKSTNISIALEGSRNFRSPAGLGEVRYEGCEILVIREGIDGPGFLKSAAASAKRLANIGGRVVAVFEEKNENELLTTFVAFPRRNIVLIATSEDYLRTVLSRIRQPQGPRALPPSLPEWRRVDTRSPVWALRHYRTTGFEDDPTSPFQKDAAASFPDDKAVGLTFQLDPSGKTARLDYFTGNPKAKEVICNYTALADAATAAPDELKIRFTEPAPDVTEGVVDLKPEAMAHLLFGIYAMLGHAIYV